MHIATDIICGFPGETDEDFAQTVSLIEDYKLSQVHISQFYPRPGTPAARMKKVPSNIVKKRSRELTGVFEAFTPYNGMEGRIERVWITDIATDRVHLVGHTKAYVQVLIVAPESMLGSSAMVKVTSVGRWSVFGEVIEIVTEADNRRISSETRKEVKCVDEGESCACSGEEAAAAAACACGPEGCIEEKGNTVSCNNNNNAPLLVGGGLSLRKLKANGTRKMVDDMTSDLLGGSSVKEEEEKGEWGLVDRVFLGGLIVSLFTVIALLLHLGFRMIVSK